MTDILLNNQSDELQCSSNIAPINRNNKYDTMRRLDEDLAAEYAEYMCWVALYEEKYGEEDAIDTETEHYWREQVA